MWDSRCADASPNVLYDWLKRPVISIFYVCPFSDINNTTTKNILNFLVRISSYICNKVLGKPAVARRTTRVIYSGLKRAESQIEGTFRTPKYFCFSWYLSILSDSTYSFCYIIFLNKKNPLWLVMYKDTKTRKDRSTLISPNDFVIYLIIIMAQNFITKIILMQ
jgi:hypothetical protein